MNYGFPACVIVTSRLCMYLLLNQAPGQADGDLPQFGLVRGGAAARLPVGSPAVPLLRHPGGVPVRGRRMRSQGTGQDHGQAQGGVQV